MLKRQTKLGKTVEDLEIGEKLHITETITDKDLLLYLGLTNDNNPLYIQHDYAQTTTFNKPIVPTILLNGIITSAISKHLPGPGSHILEQTLLYPEPVYHDETVDFILQVREVHLEQNKVIIDIQGYNDNGKLIVSGSLAVLPPYLT